MLDKWLEDDINNLFTNGSTVVLIDESKSMENILDRFDFGCNIYKANSPLEELYARYTIENTYGERNLIYTNTKYEKLKFILEYASVNGYISIYSLSDYVKNKLYTDYNIIINNLSIEQYKSAAIYSIGRDISYWHTIQTVGAEGILDIKKDSLLFLNKPEEYLSALDITSRNTFCKKISEILNVDFIEKPAKTIAKELSTAIFDNLLYSKNNKVLEDIYNLWIDSKEFNESFKLYLNQFSIDKSCDIWNCSYLHPFEYIDKQIVFDFMNNINNREFKSNHSLYLNKRLSMINKLPFDISYYEYLKTFINFDSDSISQISDISKAITYYTQYLYRLDNATRKLLSYFSTDKDIIQKIEDYYKEQISVFLDKWFMYFETYKQNQTGCLQRIINENSGKKIAIIVGDGISYSVGMNISQKINSASKFVQKYICSDYPSETENNMSQIYCDDGRVEKIQQNRRAYLSSNNPNLNIEYIDIENIGKKINTLIDVLICSAKDIDDLGEKLQAQALKYFDNAESVIANAVELLLNEGFHKVYLISDHGFVLTSVLSDSDKIEVKFNDQYRVNERYIESQSQQISNKLIEKTKNNKYYYFAKSMNPFKSTGEYGYAHGGLTPQELITPLFSWEKQADLNLLNVFISNKPDLQDVVGELFTIKLSTELNGNSLFSSSRKFFINFYVDGKCIQTSEIYEISAEENIKKEFSLNGHKQIQIQILDANTKELLDSVNVIKNQGRDLDGLF